MKPLILSDVLYCNLYPFFFKSLLKTFSRNPLNNFISLNTRERSFQQQTCVEKNGTLMSKRDSDAKSSQKSKTPRETPQLLLISAFLDKIHCCILVDKMSNDQGKSQGRKPRGENWSREEKDVFLEIMKKSSAVIENKKTDTNTNKKKTLEWKQVQAKLKELCGNDRDIEQLKGFWRRVKGIAKKNVADHKKALRTTGGGPRPATPSEDDQKIMVLCPTDFVEETNMYDSDGVQQHLTDQDQIEEDANATIYDIDVSMNEDIVLKEGDIPFADQIITINDVNINNDVNQVMLSTQKGEDEVYIEAKKMDKEKKNFINNKKSNPTTATCKNKNSHKAVIVSANIDLKKKATSMLEEEHQLKMKYQQQELCHQELRHKLEIDLLLLEKKKKELELKILEKN